VTILSQHLKKVAAEAAR